MTRADAVQRLESELSKTILSFIISASQDNFDDAFSAMGWIGEDLHRLMAKAAMAVWESSAEVQAFMKEQGVEAVG